MTKDDLFADALWEFYTTGKADLQLEREDGLLRREEVSWYFTRYREFPSYEKNALRWARGRVLDLGCGAGRHALYLQRRGLRVLAMDCSPRLVELARARGVREARAASACSKLPFRDGRFDTVILFGNNLGICGTPRKFQRMLRELHRITTPRGRILATTRMPSTMNPTHRWYLRRNLARGRALGQIRLRLIHAGTRGEWFDLLLLAPTDVMIIAAREGWELTHVFTAVNFEQGYAVVLEKSALVSMCGPTTTA